MAFAAEQMAGKLGHDPELCSKLIPSWEVGCRRITPGMYFVACHSTAGDCTWTALELWTTNKKANLWKGPGYLESLTQSNCHLTNSKITKISKNAVHTEDGKVHEVDVGKLESPSVIHMPLLTGTSGLRNRL